ncbi:MAG: 50S ribosomal protein L31 [Anaerolineales bacterium]|nr:50S ribosomal protein L31 [Anaerolineales bacterium]
MKEDIHPEWYPEAKVICACGNTFSTGATQAEIRTDVCSACHPFFTGEQRIVDTAGQVERFMRRLQRGEEVRSGLQEQREATQAGREADGDAKVKHVFEDEAEEAEVAEPAEE